MMKGKLRPKKVDLGCSQGPDSPVSIEVGSKQIASILATIVPKGKKLCIKCEPEPGVASQLCVTWFKNDEQEVFARTTGAGYYEGKLYDADK
jgi:hypothetical protein